MLPVLDGILTINTPVYENSLNIVSQYYPHITIDAPYMYLDFEDRNVLNVLLANGVGDGNGITVAQAEAVTSIGAWFSKNTAIETFDEFERFTGVTSLIDGAYIGGTDLYQGAFRACSSLLRIKLPDSIKTIGNGSFASCTSLKYVDIPNSVTAIKACAFTNTPQLETTIPEYVTTIEFRAFYDSGLSGDLYLPNLSGTIDKDSTFQNTKITSISNLGAITEVGGWYGSNRGAFRNCTLLETVVLPNTLKKIGDGPFYGCTALRECNIPSGVTYIGPSAFYNCTSFEIKDLSIPNLETLGQNAFYGVKVKKISNLGKLTALPNATSATQNFGDKSVLEEVVIPSGVTTIGTEGFRGYSTLKKINLDNITSIGGYCFMGCNSLVDCGDISSLQTIAWQGFYGAKLVMEVLRLDKLKTLEQ
jgi:hypothetical protein